MGIKQKWGMAVCLLACVSVYAVAQVPEKRYKVPHAMVTYRISGGGVLTPDINLTLEGNGTLWFKEWGAEEFIARHIAEKTTGVLHDIRYNGMCQKRLKKQMLDVDYKNKKIRERPLPKGKGMTDMKQGLSLIGQQMVGNVICNMWEGNGIKRCFYKGIPLFTEYRVLGIYYREEATDVSFDLNVSDENNCTLPDYPVEKFALFTTHFKTNSKKSFKPLAARLQEILGELNKKGKSERHLSDKERKALLEQIGKPIFEKQKQLLPTLLQMMKKTRACLVQAKETTDANACLKPLTVLKNNFSNRLQKPFKNWSKEREMVLDRCDENIVSLQSKMKCIRGAKRLDDLSLCMQQ
jgi:hypothetical protein